MTDLINTLAYATTSSASRGAISAIDRIQFGVRRKKITFTNVHNNVAALFVALLFAGAFGRLGGFTQQLLSVRVIVFAALLQITANAFSYAFTHMKVSSIIVVAKISDMFVAPLIFLLFAKWSTADFTFAAVTSLTCFGLMAKESGKSLHLKASVLVCVLLVIQGALSPWYMSHVVVNRGIWVPFTCALICWRLVFSLVLSAQVIHEVHLSFAGHDKEYWILHVVRAGLTLSAQVFQVLALSYDRPVVAWPVLNATGLFAVLFSYLVLKERASFREATAIILIAVIGAARTFV